MNSMDHLALAETHGIGYVDALNFHHISGWVWNPEAPDEAVLIEVLDGDQQLAVVRADRYRPDLQALGMGNGRHGFAFDFGGTILPNARHLIHIRRLPDGADLQTSPRMLEREGSALDRSTRHYIESLFSAEAVVAKTADDLNFALGFLVDRLSGLLHRQV